MRRACWSVPTTASWFLPPGLLGGAYLVLIDTVARNATAAEIPLGVLTAAVGAPIFAMLLRRMYVAEARG